jgi:hypothetical protein
MNTPAYPQHSRFAAQALHETKPTETCPYCSGRQVIRKGIRNNKYGDVQLFYCQPCKRKFRPLVSKGKTFPLRVILDSLSLHNRLYTLESAAKAVTIKYGVPVSRQNVRNWIDSYRDYLPFLRLRPQVLRTCNPRKLLIETQLLHGQVYAFKYHRATMDLISEQGSGDHAAACAPLARFLESVPRECPHELFRQDRPRASSHKQKFNINQVVIAPRDNAAVKNARFVLQAVSNNKLRHETLQDFMLTNDSATVAVEVPITLDADDLAHFRTLGYEVPLTLARGEHITGHIDIVQVRYGLIHVLDYKPGAKKIKPIEQLTIYALALSRRTGIRLNHFKCAWFDDEHFFEFYPRTVVQKRKAAAT